ncbi:hypothetical protein [Mycobacterium avium]|uniref:hypothetical protein n=1 Tax=Mycobacterium avium TaxID=1764 RepID=UPI000B1B4A77|nr:hypothetical protein [Mycobacterium avium]
MSTNPVCPLDARGAREVTDRIRTATQYLWTLVVTAYQRRAWLALGYKSWDAYCDKEFGDLRLKLPRESRREIMLNLRDNGLSLRAISSVTGYDKHTVSRDLKGTPARPVTGCNGKRYTRHTDPCGLFLKLSCTIAKIGDRVAELAGNSGFGDQQERIKEASLRDLMRARDSLNQVITKLEGVTA